MGSVLQVMLGIVAALSAPDAIRTSVERVLDDSYQVELPTKQAEVDNSLAASTRGRDKRNLGSAAGRQRGTGSAGSGAVIVALLWVLLAAVAFTAALWAARLFRRRARRVDDRVETTEDGAEVLRSPGADDTDIAFDPRDSAEELARLGQFGSAIHTLLQCALSEYVAGMPRSYTCREIVARVAVPEPARAALAELVAVAEECHFGNRAAGRTEYELCRENFERFAAGFAAARAVADGAGGGDQ